MKNSTLSLLMVTTTLAAPQDVQPTEDAVHGGLDEVYRSRLEAAIDAVAELPNARTMEIFVEQMSFDAGGDGVEAISRLTQLIRTDGAAPSLDQLDLYFDHAGKAFTEAGDIAGVSSCPALPNSLLAHQTLVVSADGDGWARQYAYDVSGVLTIGTAVRFETFTAYYDNWNRQLSVVSPFTHIAIHTLERLCQPAPFGARDFKTATESLLKRGRLDDSTTPELTVYRVIMVAGEDEVVPFYLGGRIGVSTSTGAIEYMRLPESGSMLPVHFTRLQVDPTTEMPLRGFTAVITGDLTEVTRWAIIESVPFRGDTALALPAGTGVFDFRTTGSRFIGNVENLNVSEFDRRIVTGSPLRRASRAADDESVALPVTAYAANVSEPSPTQGSATAGGGDQALQHTDLGAQRTRHRPPGWALDPQTCLGGPCDMSTSWAAACLLSVSLLVGCEQRRESTPTITAATSVQVVDYGMEYLEIEVEISLVSSVPSEVWIEDARGQCAATRPFGWKGPLTAFEPRRATVHYRGRTDRAKRSDYLVCLDLRGYDDPVYVRVPVTIAAPPNLARSTAVERLIGAQRDAGIRLEWSPIHTHEFLATPPEVCWGLGARIVSSWEAPSQVSDFEVVESNGAIQGTFWCPIPQDVLAQGRGGLHLRHRGRVHSALWLMEPRADGGG